MYTSLYKGECYSTPQSLITCQLDVSSVSVVTYYILQKMKRQGGCVSLQGFPILKKVVLMLAKPHPHIFWGAGGKIMRIGTPWFPYLPMTAYCVAVLVTINAVMNIPVMNAPA